MVNMSPIIFEPGMKLIMPTDNGGYVHITFNYYFRNCYYGHIFTYSKSGNRSEILSGNFFIAEITLNKLLTYRELPEFELWRVESWREEIFGDTYAQFQFKK